MDPYRLPRRIVPTRYDLYLEPDLVSSTFRGRVVVTIDVRESGAEIVLNAADLHVGEATAENDLGERLSLRSSQDAETERCMLTAGQTLSPGPWRLRMSFEGTLNERLRGFYRSTYRNAAGETRPLAATQFEATDARRAFPCWDEPDFKAVFATTLAIDPSLTAVSNTSVRSEEVQDGKKVLRFADTIPMSTYLVAFVIGELEATEPTQVGITPLRVWCVPGKKHLAGFGQEIGAFSLRFFENYYQRPYPGDKLDLLAIPDFAAGAMENLGAITFRETALLVDERAASHAERERVAVVVAHENAHMWFGDLVTMSWWNGLWLNEAFATFMEMLAVDAWKPEWRHWTTFGVARAAALTVDGLESTRPIEFPVHAPSDAEAMFDVLTYEKGASVLRMIEQHLGPEVFRSGVRLYLEKHAFGNAETGDLWAALGQAAGQGVPEIMQGWVFQPGYPLLSARTEGSQLVLSQQRFRYLPAKDSSEPAQERWQVPVQVRITSGNRMETRKLLLSGTEVRLDLPASLESVVVNEGGHGFYRVRYAPELLERLLRHLDGLAAIERFNLVNDSWAAVLAGLMPLVEYLEMTAHFQTERDKNVWSVIISSFGTLNRVVDEKDRPRLATLLRGRLAPAFAVLGWEPRAGEDDLTSQMRGDLLRALGTLGNDVAIQERAAAEFKAHLSSEGTVDANVLAAVIPVLAHAGDTKRYDEFAQRYRSAKTPQEEQRYLYALAGFRQPALIEQTLARSLGGDIRTQDAGFVIRSLLMSVYARQAAWRFVQANWEKMSGTYPVNAMRRMYEGVIGLATPAWEREVRQFFELNKIDLGGKTLSQYLEQLRIQVGLGEREGKSLHDYLARFGG